MVESPKKEPAPGSESRVPVLRYVDTSIRRHVDTSKRRYVDTSIHGADGLCSSTVRRLGVSRSPTARLTHSPPRPDHPPAGGFVSGEQGISSTPYPRALHSSAGMSMLVKTVSPGRSIGSWSRRL